MTEDGQHLGQGVAPSLPDFYNAAIIDAGIEIGMGVGSCGTAAFTGERVIVEDISSHPYWADYKTLAAQAGLAACWSQPIVSSAGQILGTFAIYYRQTTAPTPQDIATIEKLASLAGIVIDYKQTQAALKASEDKFRTLFETTSHGVVFLDVDGHITSANPAAQRIWGLTMAQLQDQVSLDSGWNSIREDGSSISAEQHPIMLALKSGQPVKDVMLGVQVPERGLVWLMVSATPMFQDGQLTKAYAILEDVTERHQMQLQVQQLAFNDALTQLPNRRLLADRLQHALTASKRSSSYGALMFLDLDNFKPLNDTCGHDAGDLLLVEVARRLKSCVREVDTVARFGGDEFVVMLVNLDTDRAKSQEQALSVAEKIRISLAEPYEIQAKTAGDATRLVTHHCTASMGVTLFIHGEGEQAAILQRADAAMYQAKDAGRNTIWFDGKAGTFE
ncbi:MAG: diguanylate cyclase/phosphodiesterase with PAS/PAC and GAF sensor(s) [Comamonadaceae bacterium]|nr:MAG: diguanylate cyclase/phosphodiesterase with PAS/PAC and GAF sensor(s) [Comamonadaceae bacterium]